MSDTNIFMTKESFAAQVEQKVLHDDVSYFEAILELAEDCDKSPEEMLPLMSQVLLDKVKKSASDSGLIDLKENDLGAFLS
jgi:Phage late-transcription coactivator